MKKLIFSLVVFSVLLLTGCQENSITDPAQFDPKGGIQKTSNPLINSGILTLAGMLQDPYPVMNSFYIINGQIEYKHKQVSQNYVSLQLLINANFQYLCTVCSPSETDELVGFISDDSEEYLLLSGNSAILEKSFTIQGRDDRLILKCRFIVTNARIELNAMWLKLPDINDITSNQTNNL